MRSKSLLQIATEHPELSIPLFAGAVSLVSATAIGRHLVEQIAHYRGLPPAGNLLPAVYFLFVCGVLVACAAALRRVIVREGWSATVGLARGLMSQMRFFDRMTVCLIGLCVVAFMGAFLFL